ALRYFHHVNHVTPRRIIFYRDGVSEGEYQTIEEVEIRALSELPESGIPKGVPIPLIFIVVGKRHHLRFFQGPGPNIKDKTGNVFGGLVVDKDVTSPSKSDFYLQSHPGLKGTSRPSHYIVLYNKLGFSIDIVQQISYLLCYAYARCTRSVSIPAPVYYADIVCSRAGFYLDENLGYSDFGSGGSGFDLNVWRKGFNAPALKACTLSDREVS
ncbi:Piwi domain-containing protein, partial [Russula vinacea]